MSCASNRYIYTAMTHQYIPLRQRWWYTSNIC